MTRSTQQTYIQRLGFQDVDRQNQRHGLACEYLAEQLFEQTVFSLMNAEVMIDVAGWEPSPNFKKVALEKGLLIDCWDKLLIDCANEQVLSIKEKALKQISYSNFINVPIKNKNYINGFADILISKHLRLTVEPKRFDNTLKLIFSPLFVDSWSKEREIPFNLRILGEVKITPEPAENILQQIKFYREFVEVTRVVILVDFDAPDLQRLVKGSDIELYRLGDKFETWVKNRAKPTTEEF
jgi:hypothetical protein